MNVLRAFSGDAALQVGTAESSATSAGLTTTVTITPGVPVSVTSGAVHTPERGLIVAKKSSRIAGQNHKDEGTRCYQTVDLLSIYWLVVSSESSEGNEEESSDVDVDYMEDYDSEEERRQRKKKVHFQFHFLFTFTQHSLGTCKAHEDHSLTTEDYKK